MNNALGVVTLFALLLILLGQLMVGLAHVDKRVGQVLCALVVPELLAWVWLMTTWLAPGGAA